MIRSFIICQEEPFFIPKQVKHLLDRSGSHFEVVGASVLSPARKGRGLGHWFRERARVYRKRELAAVLFATAFCKLWGGLKHLLGGTDPYSVKARFREHGIPLLPTKDLDDPTFIEELRQLNPDVIVSISSPQRFSKTLLEVPTRYCLNLHATLLPRHRGVFGTWWTLYEGDEEAGASIHTMEERLDAGELLWQEAFPVGKEETQFSLAERSKQKMTEGLVDLLHRIDEGKEEPIPARYTPSYNRAPSREAGKAFQRSGKRILRLKDLRRALRPIFAEKGGDNGP